MAVNGVVMVGRLARWDTAKFGGLRRGVKEEVKRTDGGPVGWGPLAEHVIGPAARECGLVTATMFADHPGVIMTQGVIMARVAPGSAAVAVPGQPTVELKLGRVMTPAADRFGLKPVRGPLAAPEFMLIVRLGRHHAALKREPVMIPAAEQPGWKTKLRPPVAFLPAVRPGPAVHWPAGPVMLLITAGQL